MFCRRKLQLRFSVATKSKSKFSTDFGCPWLAVRLIILASSKISLFDKFKFSNDQQNSTILPWSSLREQNSVTSIFICLFFTTPVIKHVNSLSRVSCPNPKNTKNSYLFNSVNFYLSKNATESKSERSVLLVPKLFTVSGFQKYLPVTMTTGVNFAAILFFASVKYSCNRVVYLF